MTSNNLCCTMRASDLRQSPRISILQPLRRSMQAHVAQPMQNYRLPHPWAIVDSNDFIRVVNACN